MHISSDEWKETVAGKTAFGIEEGNPRSSRSPRGPEAMAVKCAAATSQLALVSSHLN
jgi:hypothetical protein